MTAPTITRPKRAETVRRVPVAVYFAGPIDYIEHRSPAAHLTENWRHRFFGGLPFDLLCPVCINREPALGAQAIVERNQLALSTADLLVAKFDHDPSFGTPIEIWEWCHNNTGVNAVLIHPQRLGVMAQYLVGTHGLAVVGTDLDARVWLERRLRAMGVMV